ncbi:terpene cyclase/mutase family protein [Stieleria sp. JC731]|uniref:prenyltransferase/squalene oxidase repeat-containing protein n=1 Tax=Pirellulaceae TaxID=2691357 RepID=UPI001E286D4B|nr:prenyltransferase/squalene oxidase repeat-containing protein [Stieleria sp. JC731]MCC9603652.1 terpene cyclase/mutase family protein [Stieleria sp. JC731]
MTRRWNFDRSRRIIVLLGFATLLPSVARSHEKSPSKISSQTKQKELVDKGLQYLAGEGQDDNGMFSSRVGPGVTALAVTAALRNGRDRDDALVASGLKALESFVHPDGGIYGNGRLKNYETCVAMVAFSEANSDGKYNDLLMKAKEFVTGVQYGKADRDASDPWYGGSSYGGSGRPDLSNTGYLIEALHSMETSSNDPAIQAALAFVSRSQNLNSKFNDTQFADKVDDGGFYYEIPTEKIDPSTSEERYTANGGLRSYGSMSYTGLKSMIYAGLTDKDPRVKAAVQWVSDHYDVTSNPGMGSAGLYYYYHTFAAGLDAAGLSEVTDADGVKHDWRADLVNELAKRQNDDGSWSNENRRWFENDKNLATAFALLALSHAKSE